MVRDQRFGHADSSRDCPQEQLVELYEKIRDEHVLDSSQGLQFCAELNMLVETLNWDDVADFSDSLSELFQAAANACAPTLASHMILATEIAVRGYSVSIADDELTSLHMVLATLCANNHLHSEYLQVFTKTSQELPPLTNPSEYFQNCSSVHAERKDWTLAAMYSSLALTQEPNATTWRKWVLYELIAFGKTHELPKAFQPSVSCPLVAELAMHFSSINKATGRALILFCSENEDAFKERNIWPLVQLSCSAFYVRWLRQMGPAFSVVSWDSLAPIMSPISLDRLVGAGLRQWFLITESPEGELLISPKNIEHDDEKALRILDETSLVATWLSQ